VIDSDGYRANVGIVITNEKKQILLAKRFKQDAWQLPQGGIDQDETELVRGSLQRAGGRGGP